MNKVFYFYTIFLVGFFLPTFAFSDELSDALWANDRDQVVQIILGNSTDTYLSNLKKTRVRLVLMERLVILDKQSKDDRRKTIEALVKLFPKDNFIRMLAMNEGMDAVLKESDSSINENTTSPSGAFTQAVSDRSVAELLRLIPNAIYLDRLPDNERRAAIEILLEYVSPLPASNAEANRDGYKALLALEPENSSYREKAKRYTTAVKDKQKSILQRMRTEVDEFRNITFYTHNNIPKYSAKRSYLSIYAGYKDNQVTLRMKLNYTHSNWLFINRASLNIDGEIIDLPPSDWERDSHSRLWEWTDVFLDAELRAILMQVEKSKSTIVRFNGTKYYHDMTVSENDKQVIRDMFLLEKVLPRIAN